MCHWKCLCRKCSVFCTDVCACANCTNKRDAEDAAEEDQEEDGEEYGEDDVDDDDEQ